MNRIKVNEAAMQKAMRASADGKRVCDICRELNIHRNTFFLWKKKYRKMREEEERRLDELEAENVRLRQRNAALALNNRTIAELLLS